MPPASRSGIHVILTLITILTLSSHGAAVEASNDDYTAYESLKRCTPYGKVSIFIKSKNGSYIPIPKIPHDLLCTFSQLKGSNDCSFNNETKKLELQVERFQNMIMDDIGMYGVGSKTNTVRQRLIVFITKENENSTETIRHGCHGTMHKDAIPKDEPWLALIQRGECFFSQKLDNAVNNHGASGFVMYNDDSEKSVVVMNLTTPDLTTILINYTNGQNIAMLDLLLNALPLDNLTYLPYTNQLYAKVEFHDCEKRPSKEKKTSLPVTIVTITFVVVMIIALAWLVVYYFQKHRNASKHIRLQQKKQRAAKKALKIIGQRVIKEHDKEADKANQVDCTYCLEPLLVGEVIRELPCSHVFHKECVENWLIHNRKCPNCSCDIIVATGISIRGLETEDNDDMVGTEMSDLSPPDAGREHLLSEAQGSADNLENDSATPNWGSQVIPGTQLLTDGEKMFLFVPEGVEVPADHTIQIANPPPDLLRNSTQSLQTPDELQNGSEDKLELMSNEHLADQSL